MRISVELVGRLAAAKRVTVLTGAGVSQESGVPTVRDAQTGLWARYRAEDLATKADDYAHNLFLVNDEPRVKIATQTTEGVNWGLGVWHKVRLERTRADGAIRVFFDDFSQPIMTATDTHFDAGMIGFGSFDDTGMVANIRVWGPGLEPARTGFFR